MTMDSRPPQASEVWAALEERKAALETFAIDADAWLDQHPTIKERLNHLTALHQSSEDAAAVLDYIKSEAHPAALFIIARARDLSAAGLDPNPVMKLLRTMFAAGYQQALRDAMDEEIVR